MGGPGGKWPPGRGVQRGQRPLWPPEAHHMIWDRDDLTRFERWRASRAGSYALTQECHLLERLTAGWPRRGRTLLDVGCGPGVFLEFFHTAGFDVTGFDNAPVMLAASRERLANRAELHLGDAVNLPYDDNEFDYVALLNVLEFVSQPQAVLAEAARVAKHALLVGYLNGISLYRLEAHKHKLLGKARWFTPWGMRSLVRSVACDAPVREASVLAGPPCSWREGFPLWGMGRLILPIPVGAFCVLSVDLDAEALLTPLPGWTANAQPTKSF